MRLLLAIALATLSIPLVAALSPTEAYVGADLAAASTVSCIGPMTLQVQRNAAGTWDVLVRETVVAPSPLAAVEPATFVTSATNCPFASGSALTYTGMAGSPSAGLRRDHADACYQESVRVSPFTLGGPATFSYWRSYARSCYGTGYTFGMTVSPPVMG